MTISFPHHYSDSSDWRLSEPSKDVLPDTAPCPSAQSPIGWFDSSCLDPSRCYLVLLGEDDPEVMGIDPGADGRSFEGIELDVHPLDWLFGLDLEGLVGGLAVISPGRVVTADQSVTGSVDSGCVDSGCGAPDQSANLDVTGDVLVIASVYSSGESTLHISQQGEQRLLAGNAFGLVPDAMRRALGLSTSQPEIDPGWYWAMRWLEEIRLDGVCASPGVLGLEDVICAHPVVEPCELDDQTWIGLSEFCRGRHAEHSWLTGWGGIRDMLANPERPPVEDSTMQILAAARWYDDGSFSRWYVNSQPQLAEVFEGIAVFLTQEATDLVRSIINDSLRPYTL